VGEKGRRPIPFIGGDYATEAEILASAQEYFLCVVQGHTPAPLVSLRYQILPKYRAAFEVEKSYGRSETDIKKLAVHAVANVVLSGEFGSLQMSRAFPDLKESPPLSECAADLINWSKHFNLTGKRATVETPVLLDVHATLIDCSWTIIAAIQTILHWHFAPAGWLFERRNPPSWRPPLVLFKRYPKAIEPLAPIELKRPLVWEAMTPEYKYAGSPEYLGEVDEPSWPYRLETESQFRQRAQAAFDRWLEFYVTNQKKGAAARGLLEVPKPIDLTHFLWAARYQVDNLSASIIARDVKVEEGTVDKAVKRILDLIHLERRPGKRGPKRPSQRSVQRKPRQG